PLRGAGVYWAAATWLPPGIARPRLATAAGRNTRDPHQIWIITRTPIGGGVRPMPATADNLRDLHHLHQRARALRDRLSSAPKTLAARHLALASRQAELEAARKALQDAKVQLKKHEHSLQGIETKLDDLKVKLNQVKKNEEYKALQNQIAHDNTTRSKLEEEILLAL